MISDRYVKHVTDGDGETCRVQRVVLPGGAVTWTVLDEHARVVGPAEEFLEFLRVQASSPNTVKSYARSLALWWSYLTVFGLAWDAVTLSRAGGFLSWLRTGEGPRVTSIVPRTSRFSESTISTRLRAVTSCYRFHEGNGVALGGDLVRLVHGGRAVYKPMLEHIARRDGRERAVVRVRVPRRMPPPVLTPAQIEAVCEACASWDAASGQYEGRVRDRLLWALLAETGLRLGEALSLQHRDWHTGRGDTPFIEVVPRDGLPHGVRVKGQRYRRVFISDELDRLYGEYLWQLCDAGADVAVPDLDAAQVFVNLAGGTRFAPWRPDSVYALVSPAAPRPGGHRPGGVDAALAQALSCDSFAAGRGAGARGVPPAGSRGCADHAGDVRACDRGSRDARGGRVACAGRTMADRGCRRRADRAMLMTRHLNSAGEPAAAGPGGPGGLWAQVPAGLRSPRLSPEHRPGGVPLGLPALRRWHSQQPRPDAHRPHRASRRAAQGDHLVHVPHR